MDAQELVITDFSFSQLPPFVLSGHLPIGVHDCSLDALALATRFNDHRRKMWSQLTSFLAWPILSQQFSHAYIGGGFVSDKAEPSDIDVILETEKPYGREALAAVARFFAVGLDQIQLIYGIHLHFWMQDAPPGFSDYRRFFQYDRPQAPVSILNRSRGIARLSLTAPDTLIHLRYHLRGEVEKASSHIDVLSDSLAVATDSPSR